MKQFKIILFFCIVIVASISSAYSDDHASISISEEESLFEALRNNFEIQIKGKEPLIGQEAVELARSAFDPTLFGSVTATKSVTPSTSAFADPEELEVDTGAVEVGVKQTFESGTSVQLSTEMAQGKSNSSFSGLDPEYSHNLTLSLTRPLLKGSGRDINSTEIVIAKNSRAMSDDDFATKVMDVLTRTRETYWEMVYLNGALEVQKESLERAKDFLKRIELKVEVGMLAPIEIAAAQADVAVREEALIDIRHNIGNTQDKFKALINKKEAAPGSAVVINPVDEPIYTKVALDMNKLKEVAYKNRPDYHTALLDIENKQKKLAYNKNQTEMKLDLEGSLKLKGASGDGQPVTVSGSTRISRFAGDRFNSSGDMLSKGYYDFSIGLVAEYPLYNRSAKSRVAKSMLELNIAQTKLLNLKQVIDLEVHSAGREIRTAEQRIKATKVSRILAERKLDAEMKKYDVGSSTSFAVLEFQSNLASEKSKEIKAVTDYIKALARLEKSMGMVLKNHNITLGTLAQ